MPEAERYHVLLIGIDQYPPEQRSLAGCVNDIDAVEDLLLGPPGVGLPLEQISVTRMAAPLPGAAERSRFASQTVAPTRDNILAALGVLGGPAVGPGDRVLIYYSGHGSQIERVDRRGWFECLVSADNRLIFDYQLNPLVAAIAARTPDLTVVLDCCHAAGATRDIGSAGPAGDGGPAGAGRASGPVGATRGSGSIGASRAGGPATAAAARYADPPASIEAPPPALEPVAPPPGPARGARLLQSIDPPYLVVAACHADERAHEGPVAATRHGLLTYGLLKAVGPLPPEERARLRWADLWPALLAEVTASAAALRRSAQHPWMIGRPERRVFGGAWTPQDAGLRIAPAEAGLFAIAAGHLLGVGVGAVLGVYGPTPDRFPPIGTPEDTAAQIGLVQVVEGDRSTCRARALVAPPRELPPGARARLLRPGAGERLRVWLRPSEPALAAILAGSPLLELVDELGGPEVWVTGGAGRWLVSNAVNEALATLRGGDEAAFWRLRAGLESYARYQVALRLATRCCDPALDQRLLVALPDCADAPALAACDPKQPDLPLLPRDDDQVYAVTAGQRFCIRLSNLARWTLYVTVLNCSAGGLVELLGETSVRPDDSETVWLQGVQRQPFVAMPDNPAVAAVDRIVAVATTRPGVDLRGLSVDMTVQAILDSTTRSVGSRGREVGELWTATVVPLRIR